MRSERIKNIIRRNTQRRTSIVGIEHNSIPAHMLTSGYVYSVDIARSPYVVNGDFENFNIQAKATKANGCRGIVDYRAGKIKGRGML